MQLEAIVVDFDDNTSAEEDSKEVAAPYGDWNDVTNVYFKHFPYSAVNTGACAMKNHRMVFFKYFIRNDDIINYMVMETNCYAFEKIQKIKFLQ